MFSNAWGSSDLGMLTRAVGAYPTNIVMPAVTCI
jgi:hypothetical protein